MVSNCIEKAQNWNKNTIRGCQFDFECVYQMKFNVFVDVDNLEI